jgi:hypothetical protein
MKNQIVLRKTYLISSMEEATLGCTAADRAAVESPDGSRSLLIHCTDTRDVVDPMMLWRVVGGII